MQDVIDRAISMANTRNGSRFWSKVDWFIAQYTINDNPYDHKTRKKEHVLWHNEFRKERVKHGRRVM